MEEALRAALISDGFPSEDIQFPKDISQAQVYNLLIPVVPIVILSPHSAEHVSIAIRAAKSFGLRVQARSGGHSYANHCLGGVDGHMVLDMKHMKDLYINRETWIAHIGPGLRLNELAWTLHDNGGRMIPQGTCGNVGLGGHATTGGMGPCTREYGLMLDSIREMEVVTAEGDILRINKEQHADLFWAMRGAGASFGIATEFVIETYPEPESTLGFNFSFTPQSPSQIAPILKKWQKFIQNPDLNPRFATIAYLTNESCHIIGNYRASQEEFDALSLEDIFKGQPLEYQRSVVTRSWVDHVMPKARTDIPENETPAQETTRRAIIGLPTAFASNTMTVKESHPLPDETFDEWFNYMANTESGTTSWVMILECSNGFVNPIATDATAYGHRDTLFVVGTLALDTSDERPNGDTQYAKWVAGIDTILKRAMADTPYGFYTGYVNPAADKTRYWGTNYPRLEELKTKWDPLNMFANPQSVGPGLG